jgi:hypothetical protein
MQENCKSAVQLPHHTRQQANTAFETAGVQPASLAHELSILQSEHSLPRADLESSNINYKQQETSNSCKHNGAVLPLPSAPEGRGADGVDAMA